MSIYSIFIFISIGLIIPFQVEAANTPPTKNDQVLNQGPSSPGQWSSGVHLGLPDLFSIEGLYHYSETLTFRARVSPPITIRTDVDEAADSEQIESRLQVATPKQSVPLKISYGPLITLDTLYFPFNSSFFLGFGLTARWMQVHAEKSSEMYVCFFPDSILCTAEDAFLTTDSSALTVKSSYQSFSTLVNASFGWVFEWSDSIYMLIEGFGLSYPIYTKRNVNVEADVDSNFGLDDLGGEDLDEKIDEAISRKEARLERASEKRAAKMDKTLMPIIGISVGYRF